MKSSRQTRFFQPLVFTSCLLINGSFTNGSHHAGEEIQDSRPNIIFIMSDDHAVESISCYGSQLIQTPGIDRLAEEGMRFDNVFNVNSLCAPSRAALLTGKHAYLNGFKRNRDHFDVQQVSFPILMQQAGYQTGIIGKWHLMSEPQGFDYYNVLPGQGRFFDPVLKEKGLPWEDGNDGGVVVDGYLTEVITDLAIDWISENASRKPFMLMVHHKAPHTPHHYPEKYDTLYAGKNLPLPETFSDTYWGKNPGLAFGICGFSKLGNIIPHHLQQEIPEGLDKAGFQHWAYQAFFKDYLRLVAAMDDNISRLLDYLDESGLSKNTMVIYTSDNGFFHGQHGLFNKMWMYEESLKLPLVVRFPGVIEAGSINDDLVSILDFAPTFLDMAEATIPSALQGRSIKPLFTGNKPDDWRDAVYYHYFGQFAVPEHYGIRTNRYKLIHFMTESTGKNFFGELYDLNTDESEMENLYYRPEYASIKNALEEKLTQMKIEAGYNPLSD